jgi:hypothetical protein
MINLQIVRCDNKWGDLGHFLNPRRTAIILLNSFPSSGMKSPKQVDTARTVMTEAMTWSVMKWLREKKNVRRTADQANAALDKLNRDVKERWPSPVKSAYDALAAQSLDLSQKDRCESRRSPSTDSQTLALAKKLREANDAAYGARELAEKTFDDAEKQLSTRLAREGCLRAIHAWDVLEEAIRKGEAILHE